MSAGAQDSMANGDAVDAAAEEAQRLAAVAKQIAERFTGGADELSRAHAVLDEGHDQRAVEQILHVEHRASPQPEQSGWPHLALGVGNQVNPALFDLERGVLLRLLGVRLAVTF
jgi:hypothetical protein